MNRSIKTLILAAGVAVATLTVTVPAHADGVPNGPSNLGGLQQGPIVDPKPSPSPVPAGPGDIANPPHCTHGCGGNQGPVGPKDLGSPSPAPQGPKDLGSPTPSPQGPKDLDSPAPGNDKPAADPSVAPAALDAGVVSPATTEDGGIDALWFVLGGAGLLGALVLAAVARRRRQQEVAVSDSAA